MISCTVSGLCGLIGIKTGVESTSIDKGLRLELSSLLDDDLEKLAVVLYIRTSTQLLE